MAAVGVPIGVVLGLALCVEPGSARAQEHDLDPVVVDAPAAAPSEAARAPGASSSSIDVAAVSAEGRSTAELVGRVPGVVVHDYGGPGQLATISLRGASPQQVLVLLDGVPLTGASSGLVDLATLPPAVLERIEILRGGVGPLYGMGAVGGVVNLVSRAPHRGAPTVDAEIRGGSFGTGEARLAGSANLGPGSALVALDALGTRGDFGYRPPDATADLPRLNNDATRLAGLLRFQAPWGAGRAVDLQLQLDEGARGLAGPIENPRSTDRLDDGRTLASARGVQRLANGELELRGFLRQDRLQVTLDQAPSLPEQDTLAGAEVRLKLRAGHHGLSLLARAAGEEVVAPRLLHRRPDLSLAVADEWLLADGRLSVLPALRLDQVDHFLGLSPQLALAYRPAEALELRGSVGQSFRAPTFAELYLDQGLFISNPDLTPERALSLDLGAALQLGTVRLWAGGFATEDVDLIQYELYPGARSKPFNIGTALLDGVELEASVRPLPTLELSASYTRMAATDVHDDVRFYGHTLPAHPRDRGGGRLSYTTARLAAHAEAFAQSSQFLSRSNTTVLAGRVETSAGAAWRPLRDQPIWLGLEAQNLLDERSEDLYGYPLPGRAFYALCRVAAATAPEQK